MTIRVDAAIWPWRERLWAHLVSDESLDELHEFAVSIGVRRVSFQGDHYDIDTDTRIEAIAAGAVRTDARDLVRGLRAAGLRRPPRQRIEPWIQHAWRADVGDGATARRLMAPATRHPDVMMHVVDTLAAAHRLDLSILERTTEVAVVVAPMGNAGPAIAQTEMDEWSSAARQVIEASAPLPTDTTAYFSGAGVPVLELIGPPR